MTARVMKADGPKGHLGPRPNLGHIGTRRADDKPSVPKKDIRVVEGGNDRRIVESSHNSDAVTNSSGSSPSLYGKDGFRGRLG